jgi:hypothetical protein
MPNPETGYLAWGFLWFSSVPPGNCSDSTLKFGQHVYINAGLSTFKQFHPLILSIVANSCILTGQAFVSGCLPLSLLLQTTRTVLKHAAHPWCKPLVEQPSSHHSAQTTSEQHSQHIIWPSASMTRPQQCFLSCNEMIQYCGYFYLPCTSVHLYIYPQRNVLSEVQTQDSEFTKTVKAKLLS